MNMPETKTVIEAFAFFLFLLNPFLVSVYLLDVIKNFELGVFSKILMRASLISTVVFCVFAITGVTMFRVIGVKFESFQIFGGIVFLIIGIKYVFEGFNALENIRGPVEHIAGSVAMPFLIGPGTISASVFTGQKLGVVWGSVVVVLTMIVMVISVVFIKWIHDIIRKRNEPLLERYIDITGRITALITGMIAVQMILTGFKNW